MTTENAPLCECGCGTPATPGPRFAGADKREQEAHRARFNRRQAAERAREAARLDQGPTVLGELGLSLDAPPSRLAAELEQLSDRSRRLAILVGARLELSDDAGRVRRETEQAQQVAAAERAAQDLVQVHQRARQHAEDELATVQSTLGGVQEQLAETTGELADATADLVLLNARLQAAEETAERSRDEVAAATGARRDAEETAAQAVRERDQAQREREAALVRALTAEAQASQAGQALVEQRQAAADVRAALTVERDRLLHELDREREQVAVEITAAQVLAEQRLAEQRQMAEERLAEQRQAAAEVRAALTSERDRLVEDLTREREARSQPAKT